MVKLSDEIITNHVLKSRRNISKKREEIHSICLKNVTHLYFQNKNIHEIGEIASCSNLKVFYLYGNTIAKIQNLDKFTRLTHLYLQDNKISKIENLSRLINLEKLFLGNNCIAVVEGLENLKHLQELHIEKQQLSAGEALQFDPRTTESLGESLIILNVSKNGLNSLWDICPLKSLIELHARDNSLQTFPGVCEPLSTMLNLQILDLSGNEICSMSKYRDAILVSASPKLELLDERRVHQLTREFVKNFEHFKKHQSEISIQHNDFQGLMDSSKKENRDFSDMTLYNKLPTKPVLAAGTSLFPPWSLKRTAYLKSQKPKSSLKSSSNTLI
ncbi:protein phosphatase 1 regulatory subunit 42-like [Ischnura elegans]|uniref:protein phosphatase 1 regulatory subunit 42-like n=1 Tax=Ischnura elegans TaxID=197161 RepID=UPI001ED88556|nr:protein phosphatase 1 regulatory subunit 42-like [Ischnura elegans]